MGFRKSHNFVKGAGWVRLGGDGSVPWDATVKQHQQVAGWVAGFSWVWEAPLAYEGGFLSTIGWWVWLAGRGQFSWALDGEGGGPPGWDGTVKEHQQGCCPKLAGAGSWQGRAAGRVAVPSCPDDGRLIVSDGVFGRCDLAALLRL